MALVSCRKAEQVLPPVTIPSGAVMHDRTFHSNALGRDVTYRVIEPVAFTGGQPSGVIYLLHGNGSGFEEWSRWSTIAQLAAKGYVLVMPEGHSSYFMNSATKPDDKYEDFVVHDLLADAERDLPTHPDRSRRSIVGVSMGGFGALVLAMKHPDLYGFAGALSPPVDYPRRAFTLRRWGQSLAMRSIFGPDGSVERDANDPYLLARRANSATAPFLFVSVGDQEGLREPVERFNRTLEAKGLPHVFLLGRGGHNWQQWNGELPQLCQSLTTAMTSQ